MRKGNYPSHPVQHGNKGHYYETMMEKFPEAYPTLESVGKKVGASHQQISNIITAYQQIKHLKPQLEPTIATQVAMLSEVVVRPIKSAPESAKVALVSVVAEKGLSGRESAALVEVAKANPEVTSFLSGLSLSKFMLPLLSNNPAR